MAESKAGKRDEVVGEAKRVLINIPTCGQPKASKSRYVIDNILKILENKVIISTCPNHQSGKCLVRQISPA